MTEPDAILAVLAELGRAKADYPPFKTGWEGMGELRRQTEHANRAWACMGDLNRELCQIAAVAIRMLAGV